MNKGTSPPYKVLLLSLYAMNPTTVKAFQQVVWEQHKAHAPHFPWRETRNPYHILISEVMLQQTQIPRVLVKYPQFLDIFPTIKKLAKARLKIVLEEWQGMGYNRRALYLKQAAEKIVAEHNSRIPRTIEELDAFPGIGPYSARAIACFAYGDCEPFIETNIRRVIIHEFFPCAEKVDDKDILKILATVQPKRKMRKWYWALMDYGRDGLKGKLNPNRRSKHYTKQTRFEGSTRQLRAEILRILLKKKRATLNKIMASLTNLLPKREVAEVVQTLLQLEKEQLIQQAESFWKSV